MKELLKKAEEKMKTSTDDSSSHTTQQGTFLNVELTYLNIIANHFVTIHKEVASQRMYV